MLSFSQWTKPLLARSWYSLDLEVLVEVFHDISMLLKITKGTDHTRKRREWGEVLASTPRHAADREQVLTFCRESVFPFPRHGGSGPTCLVNALLNSTPEEEPSVPSQRVFMQALAKQIQMK